MKMNKNGKKTIFIVDDDKFLVDMYAIKFDQEGFQVETSLSGSDALSKLESKEVKPDIIMLDIVMPGVDGFAVLEQLKTKKLAPGALIVILSNLGQQEDIDKGLALGAHGYIVKASSTPAEVVKKTIEILEKRGKSRPSQ